MLRWCFMDDLILKINDFIEIHIRITSEQLGNFALCDVISDVEFADMPCKNCFMNTKESLGSDLCDYPYFKSCIRKKLTEFCKGL